MTARAPDEFWVDGYSASMQFQRDATGRVTGLIYRGVHAPRVVEPRCPASKHSRSWSVRIRSDELHTSYRVNLVSGVVELHHFRHGRIPLVHVGTDEFTSANPFFRAVTFLRIGAGKVTGFSVHAGPRSRDNRFRRVE